MTQRHRPAPSTGATALHRFNSSQNNNRSPHASIGSGTSLTPSSTETPWSHVVWNNLDTLSLDSASQASNNNIITSSWQEEAHWMSFRHAVQQFNSLKLVKEVSDREEDVITDEDVSEEARISRVSSSSASNIKKKGSKGRPTSPLESDLAETKMRLALAQAERDELEFALLQKQQNSS